MNTSDAINLVNSTEKGKDFLEKYPENDVIIKYITINDAERIENEYPGIFGLKNQKIDLEFPITSISIIGAIIEKNGYPKFRVYVRNDTNEIIRILASESD